MAVVDLGKLRFDWKGDFSDATPYEERDVVRYQGGIWFFTANHFGPWNPSNVNIMLEGIDVITSEGDLITGDSSGLNSRLAVDYDFTGDLGATRAGSKAIVSKSTVPAPASQTKYLNVNSGNLYLANAAPTSTTYVITVAQDAGNNKFFIDGVVATALTMVRGSTYIFDVSDATNTGHPFRIKEDGGSAYTLGTTITGTEGTANATVTFTVPESAPDGLRYYCSIHGDPMGNAITVTGGTQVVASYTPFEQDTITLDVSDTSMVGHPPRFSSIPNGIHGNQTNTHVSYIEDSNGNKYLSVTSNVAGMTNGGTAVTVQRPIYSYVNDSAFSPTYTGSDWPYVLVTGTVSADADITATISQNTLSDGTEVLLINGRPAYQHVNDTFDTITGIGGLWVAFDDTGATTTTAYGTVSMFGHTTVDNITFTGTEGTVGANIVYAIPPTAPTIYMYDMTETSPFTTLEINPVAHPLTSSIGYTTASSVIQIVNVNELRISYVNQGSLMSNNVWYDGYLHVYTPTGYTAATWDNRQLTTIQEPGGAWDQGEFFRPQITLKADTGATVGLKHMIRMHVGWDHTSRHQGGRIMRRASSDGGQTWGSWETAPGLVESYTAATSRNDVHFGVYAYTTNAATYVYQGENVVLPFVDQAVTPGYTYQYKVQFKILNNTGYIYNGWTYGYNNQLYGRKGTANWTIEEVLL